MFGKEVALRANAIFDKTSENVKRLNVSAGTCCQEGWKARKTKTLARRGGGKRPWGGTAACVSAPLSAAFRRMTHSAKICCYFPPVEGGAVTPPECLMDEAPLPAARRKSPAQESQCDWCVGGSDSRVTETPLMHFLQQQTGRTQFYLFIGHSQICKYWLHGWLKEFNPVPPVSITE